MATKNPAFDLLTEQGKSACIKALIAYFLDEKNEEIGYIQASQILDIVQAQIVKDAYNKGLKDAQKAIKDKIADLDVELDLLKKN